MQDQELTQFITNLDNWIPQREIPNRYPQFSPSQIKILFWKRDEHPGLERCSRMVGRRMYINAPLFGLGWLANCPPNEPTDRTTHGKPGLIRLAASRGVNRDDISQFHK